MPMSRRLKSMQAWIPVLVSLLLGIQQGLAQTSVEPAASVGATAVALVNVAVVSMQDDAVLQEQTVVTQGDRIQSIGPVDAISVPPGATVIDGSGLYLMPGLADMHVHVRVPFDDGPLYLDAGVTTVLSMGTRASAWNGQRIAERRRSRSPAFMGPTLYTVGPQIADGETPDQVEQIVRHTAEGGFDFVKVHGDVSPEAFDRLHDTATQRAIRVTGHGQRHRGMHPVYANKQDLAHIEEYLYAAFNPTTEGFWTASAGMLLVLLLFSLTNVGWALGAIWRRVRRHHSSRPSPWMQSVRRWVRIFTVIAWLLVIGLALSVTEPFLGVLAGQIPATTIVGVLMVLALVAAVVLTLRVLSAWRAPSGAAWKRATLSVIVGLAWTFVVCSGFLTPRSWRTSQAALRRMAEETAAAGIWVTPTLIVLDYNKRQNTDEFYALIERPEMRYLRPSTRDRWINNNSFRRPAPRTKMQFAIWQNWTDLTSRLVGELHAANVPLLAGSDAVGPPGPLPGSSLHEELGLLVRAGLSPYEALKTATVNPASYLEAEQEFGKVVEGFRADLVLLTGNPLDDINHTRTRVGVMKRGRWFSASELESALERLAQDRR